MRNQTVNRLWAEAVTAVLLYAAACAFLIAWALEGVVTHG